MNTIKYHIKTKKTLIIIAEKDLHLEKKFVNLLFLKIYFYFHILILWMLDGTVFVNWIDKNTYL